MSVFSRIHLRHVSAAGQALGVCLMTLAVSAALLVFAPTAYADVGPGRDVAEWAREKDVVTLALTVSLALIGFCGWLIRKMFAAQERSAALWSQSIQAMNALATQLSTRPCILPTRSVLPPLL
jgi:hypothetical protein